MIVGILKGEPLPSLFIEGQLCRMFKCLPSQLREESAEIFKMAKMLDIADQIAAQDAEVGMRAGQRRR